MTREEFARKIRWPYIAWFICAAGSFTMLPQLIQIMRTHTVRDLSMTMYVMVLAAQLGYVGQGYFRRDRLLTVCMLVASIITSIIIVAILHYR